MAGEQVGEGRDRRRKGRKSRREGGKRGREGRSREGREKGYLDEMAIRAP
jgi:hypothetical protein